MIVVFFSCVYDMNDERVVRWQLQVKDQGHKRVKPVTSLLFCVNAISEDETRNQVPRKRYLYFPDCDVDESDS